ncbi:MAG TPA: glycosyltransferase family 4 protein [Candidatus Paceibacterota bacterium]
MEESRKKILFIITKGNFGGAQRYVYDLATNLPKEKFDVVVASGIKEGKTLVEKLQEKNIKTIEIESSEREVNFKNDFKALRELVKIIKKERPNIVHLNSSKIGFLGALAFLYFKFYSIIHNSYSVIQFIFTSHGWSFKEKNRSLHSRIIFYIAHYLTVLICNQTIAVSQKTKKDIDFLPFIKNKIKVVHNGISGFKLLLKREALEILPREKNEVVILSLSELHKNKGLDVAIKGFSLLPDEIKNKVKYFIAGTGEEKENLKKLAQECGADGRVKFLGFVDNAKKLLSGADIFLLPSRTENLPFALLEAGFAGVPTIATNVGGIPEVIKDMQNGILIHPKNPKEVAEAIIYLIDHKEKRKEFAAEIKKTVTNFFTLEKMLFETVSVYLDTNH